MALGAESRPANAKVADYIKQKSTKIAKPVRMKIYSSKKTEHQVRKRTIDKTKLTSDYYQYDLILPNIQSEATMFYPPCPQYYPITTNEWSPVIPIHCPLYSLQPIPVIVNPPLLSTQIHPYPQIVDPPTDANEYQVSSLVPANEFTVLVSDVPTVVTSVNNPAPVYCEMSSIVANLSTGFLNLAVCDEVDIAGISVDALTTFDTQLPDEVTTAVAPIELSPSISYVSCDFSPIATPISNIFNPIQSVQVPNEFIPICNSVCAEISPLSRCSYESLSLEYFQCDLPIIDENTHEAEVQEYKCYVDNPLEFYLSLPKDLFPTARMMTIDPNAIIDEFCRISNFDDHSWILDLEFGVPRTPITRRIATYNVKLNSINCKNVPEAIHPGFESCDKGLKRALMFYYDCVISNWYRGYIAISSDSSVENFQSWLLLPMQSLGMCWP